MSRAMLGRLKKIEDARFEESLIIINPRRFPGQEMTPDELEAHREAVRAVAMNPKGILIQYQAEGAPDPMVELFGEAEAAALSAGHRNIKARRSYWG